MRGNMIELKNVSKSFDGIEALKNVSVTVREGEVFGLIGTNGAGKSTLLRLAGVFKPDDGLAIVDNMPVYDNVHAKAKLFLSRTSRTFSTVRRRRTWSVITAACTGILTGNGFYLYLNSFGLESRRRISTFSKGMKSSSRFCWG